MFMSHPEFVCYSACLHLVTLACVLVTLAGVLVTLADVGDPGSPALLPLSDGRPLGDLKLIMMKLKVRYFC